MLQETSFREAKETLQKFLSENGISADIVWLFREDVISEQDSFLIKTPIPQENEKLAESFFEVGKARGFGVCLDVFCLLDSCPCCYVLLPDDDIDSQYMLMSNEHLKCSVRIELINAKPVTNSFLWHTKKLIAKTKGEQFSISLDKMPSKKNLEVYKMKE